VLGQEHSEGAQVDIEQDGETLLKLRNDDPLTSAVKETICKGDFASLKRLLIEHRGLASARIGKGEASRALLHLVTDWPGHFPNGAVIAASLIEGGADPNARCEGMSHTETPLHWVASNDDVEVFEVLIKAGADLEASGGSIGGGTPLDNAVGYGQWHVARRLVECGARTKLWHAAALGLMVRVQEFFTGDGLPSLDEVSGAFYQACHGGQRQIAEYLLARGADINWIPYWAKGRTPLDIARTHDGGRAPAANLVEWLIGRGAQSGSGPGLLL
jgi:uncharacterized protein